MTESFFLLLANNLPRTSYFDSIRYKVYRMAGINCSHSCKIWGPLTIRPIGGAGNISIGESTFINTNVRFGAPGNISIGDRVQIGPGVMIETASHGLRYDSEKGRGTYITNVAIEDEVWIGAGVIIAGEVTIGKGAVVAAGAVVTSDVAPNSLVGGVPAKLLKMIV